MSKRTFIPKWNPHRKPPIVRFGGRQRNVHALIDNSPPPKIAKSKEEDDGVVRWYNDPLARGIHQVSRITHERLTQRVGLFRNAKHSQIVINDFSNNVKKACRRQISRLVASDDGRCDPDTDASFNAARKIATHLPYRENTRSRQPCYRIEDPEEVIKTLRNQPCSSKRDNDSGYQPRVDIDNTWDAEGLNEPWNKDASSSSTKPHQSLHGKSAAVSSTGQNPDVYIFPFEDETVSARKQRCPNVIPRTAQDLHQRLKTHEPQQPQEQQTHKGELITNILSLPDVSVRILSALPTIYLRDDYHEKYDNVAVRLLSESIKRSENEPGSSSNVYRSLMNRTTCISTSDQRSQPTDTACENIFQDCPNGFELLSGETSVTPELEKLFNQTVGASKLDDNPDFSRCIASRSDHAAVHRQISSLLTPTSLGSHKLITAKSRPSNFVTSGVDPVDVSSWKFPFSRSPSSSESSADDIDFEWTIPEANHNEED
ncbi:unnamed protein product [Cylicocyclus nassatus]|uniref:Uncharacterized protein n=1 Tax=Cylicocyclus nassatus TaxID=53992 RepID=A0AA36H3C1_CYLNA|nr:unnamed protein product [Cylicocyclus nassatus]